MGSKEEGSDKSKNNDELCFKQAVIEALYQEDIRIYIYTKERQPISKLHHYEDRYNWQRPEPLLAIQKVGKFENNNTDIAVKVLFNSQKGIYKPFISESDRKCGKQANSLMIEDEENRHYTAIKIISRLLKSLNESPREAYQCLNGAYYC